MLMKKRFYQFSAVLTALFLITSATVAQTGVPSLEKAFSPLMESVKGLEEVRLAGVENPVELAKTSLFTDGKKNFLNHDLLKPPPLTEEQRDKGWKENSTKRVIFQKHMGGIMVQLDPVAELLPIGKGEYLSPGKSDQAIKLSQLSAQLEKTAESPVVKVVFTVENKEHRLEIDPSLLRLAAIVSAVESPNLLSLAASDYRLPYFILRRNPEVTPPLAYQSGLAINPALAQHNLAVDLLRLDISLSKVKGSIAPGGNRYLLVEREWVLEPDSLLESKPFLLFTSDYLKEKIVVPDATAAWQQLLSEDEKKSLNRFSQFLQAFRFINSLNRGHLLPPKEFSAKVYANLLKECKPYFDADLIKDEDQQIAFDLLIDRQSARDGIRKDWLRDRFKIQSDPDAE